MKLTKTISLLLCIFLLFGLVPVNALPSAVTTADKAAEFQESANLLDFDFPDTHITVPSDASLFVGLKGSKHFVSFTEMPPILKLENLQDSTVTYYFELDDNSTYNYRVFGDNYITLGGTFKKTADFTLNITRDMLTDGERNKKTIDRTTSSNGGFNVADIYLNINPSGHLKLKSGDRHQIVSLRNWEAVNSTTANYFIEPDYSYSVIDETGNPCDNIITVDKNGLITAVDKGSAIVLVTYDAMNLDFGSGRVFYGAIWPENTGVFIVSVDEEESGIYTNMTLNEGKNNAEIKLSGENIDSEHDVIYFIGDKGEYTFSPSGDNITVSVANPTISDTSLSYNGFTTVNKNADESYTVPLTHGRNIIKISNNRSAEYQIITAKKVNVTVNEGENVYAGDTLNIKFDTLYHPANKLAGVYNMTASAIYTKADGYDSRLVGGLSGQYNFASSSSAQTVSSVLKENNVWGQITYVKDTDLIVPENYSKDVFTLSGGLIYVSGWGDSYGNHRKITYTQGKGANFYANVKTAYLGRLPDIVIPITATSAPLSSISVNTQNAKTKYFAGDSFDKTGLIVTALFDDEKTQDVTNYTVTPEILTAQTTAVTIAYKGKTTEIPVKVTEPSVVSIEIAEPPVKLLYTEGDTFDPTGLVVNAIYDNGKKEETNDYTYSPNRLLTKDDTNIAVEYSLSALSPAYIDISVSEKQGSSGNTQKYISVYFTLYGDTKHSEGIVHTMAENNLAEWMPKSKLTLERGSSALDAAILALETKGIPYTNDAGDYISSVKGLSELENGSLSGWMYTVNGKYPELSISEKILKNGDKIVLHYTDDYTKERTEFAGGSSASSRNESAELMYEQNYRDVISSTAMQLQKTVKNPTVGATGGEWLILGLSRSGEIIDKSYFDTYYKNAEKYVKDKDGVLTKNKYTEYSRLIIALSSLGKNPANIGSYNLISQILDYESVIKQGLNGPVWALIALDASGYRNNKIREKYISLILKQELPKGGWALNTAQEYADIDITAMTITALSKHMDRADVKSAIDRAISYLSDEQNSDGSFGEYSESSSQVLVALSSVGISYNDSKFVKNGNTLIDSITSFYVDGKGFKHSDSDSDTNLMATEQALYALVSAMRCEDGKTSLFDMSDVERNFDINAPKGLDGKNENVKINTIKYEGKSFDDIKSHENKEAIEQLAERGIINGITDSLFCPDTTMTRAEFATIAVRALGLESKYQPTFEDVKTSDWFYSFIGTAYSYGVIKGISKTHFNPHGTITREEAAVMSERAAKLCGLDTDYTASEIKDILSEYSDGESVSSWAENSFAFCISSGILECDNNLCPKEAITRAEIAEILYNMLGEAKLI